MFAVESSPHRMLTPCPTPRAPAARSSRRVTASSSTPPVITNFVPDDSPSRPRPLSIEHHERAEQRGLHVPRPPNSDVPPITAAAIEYSST